MGRLRLHLDRHVAHGVLFLEHVKQTHTGTPSNELGERKSLYDVSVRRLLIGGQNLDIPSKLVVAGIRNNRKAFKTEHAHI